MLLKDIKLMNNVKLDFFHIEERTDKNENIFADKKYKPSLNNDSKFLVTFDDGTTISKGISASALGYNFSVYKEVENTNQLVYVSKLNEGALSVTDYNVSNNSNYKYYIFKEDEESISEAVISNQVSTCWWDWSLIDLVPNPNDNKGYIADKNSIWKLNLNLSSATKSQVLNNTTYNNLTRFPKFSSGNCNYSTGSVKCILGNILKTTEGNLSYIEPASLLDEWNAFCSNNKPKLLKDRKGNILLVFITSTSSEIDDVTREQVSSITFNWTEVEDAKKISVIGV